MLVKLQHGFRGQLKLSLFAEFIVVLEHWCDIFTCGQEMVTCLIKLL